MIIILLFIFAGGAVMNIETYNRREEMYIPPNKYHKIFVEKWYLILFQIKGNIFM